MASKSKLRNIVLTAGFSVISLMLVRCGPLSPSIAKSMQAPIPIPTPDPQASQQAIQVMPRGNQPEIVISAKENKKRGKNSIRLAVGENDIEFGDFTEAGEFEIDSIKDKKLKSVIIEVSEAGLAIAKDKRPEVALAKASDAGRVHVIFDIDNGLLKEVRSVVLVFE